MQVVFIFLHVFLRHFFLTSMWVEFGWMCQDVTTMWLCKEQNSCVATDRKRRSQFHNLLAFSNNYFLFLISELRFQTVTSVKKSNHFEWWIACAFRFKLAIGTTSVYNCWFYFLQYYKMLLSGTLDAFIFDFDRIDERVQCCLLSNIYSLPITTK